MSSHYRAMSEISSQIIIFIVILWSMRFHWHFCKYILSADMLCGYHFLFFNSTLPVWTLALEKSSSFMPQFFSLLQLEYSIRFAMLIPQGDKMTDSFQHHISEQLSLEGVQQGPLFLGEVYSYIFKHHRFQWLHCQ